MTMCVNERLGGYSAAAARVNDDLMRFAVMTQPNTEDVLLDNDHTRIARITVPAGGRLTWRRFPEASVQWFVQDGRARVTVGRMVKVMFKGDSMFVPAGTVHGLENPGQTSLVLTEVQQRP